MFGFGCKESHVTGSDGRMSLWEKNGSGGEMRRTRSRRRTGLLCQEKCDTGEDAQICKLVSPQACTSREGRGYIVRYLARA